MAIVIRKMNDFSIDNDYPVKLKHMGNIKEISFSMRKNTFCPIRLIDKDHYVKIDFNTGEISDLYDCNHIDNRSQNLQSVSQSQKRLREIINTNVVDPNQWKWITLTYSENMTDSKRLYHDFEKFMKRLRYKYNQYKIDYIVAAEPQARGAWHLHVLLGFNQTAPYIENHWIFHLWKQGFTKTQKLIDIDNIGAYLSAYLGDMEMTKENIQSLKENGFKMPKNTSELIVKEVESDGKTKKYIKGARLYMYPPKFNMYRCSTGIKKPVIEELDYFDAKIKIGFEHKPTFKSCRYLEDLDNHFNNIVAYEQYNIKRQ